MKLLQTFLVRAAKQCFRWADHLERTNLYRYDKDSPYVYAEGATLVYDLLRTGDVKIHRLYAVEYPEPERYYKEALTLAEEQGIPIICEKRRVPPKEIHRSFSVTAEIEKKEDVLQRGNHVVIVNPSLPRNTGAVMRTALAFGIRDIAVVSANRELDLLSPMVIRASMGARLKIRAEVFPSLEAYRERFPENHLYAFMLRNAFPLQEVHKEAPFSLIFGNETTGLPDEYADFCQSVFIEQGDAVDSLNISNAASIGIYEFSKAAGRTE